jgi:hypothetical protein
MGIWVKKGTATGGSDRGGRVLMVSQRVVGAAL